MMIRLNFWQRAVFRTIILIALLLCALVELRAQPLPPNAAQYLPILVQLQKDLWPDSPYPGWMGAQVEKESCIHRKHPKCWNPHAELKTKREYGFGFGQNTVAYNADGSERFNVFKELKVLDPVLRKWDWEDRFNPQMQLRALVVKNKITYDRILGARTELDHMAFSLAGYNGGLGGVISDRRLCDGTRGCDSGRWFGHVEFTSNKSRIKWQGYGQSAFEINRAYPVAVLIKLRPPYVSYF